MKKVSFKTYRESVFLIALLSIFLFMPTYLYSMSFFPADATANAGADASTCENESYTLTGTATNYSSVLWTSNGMGYFDDPTLLNATFTPWAAGIVTLTLTAYGIAPGANASDDMILTVYDTPEADFTMSPNDSACINEPITFTGTGTTDITTWDWDFDDGNTSSGQVVIHSYTNPGAYIVSLVATNINGCVDTVLYMMFVIDPIASFVMSPSPSCEGYIVFFDAIGNNGFATHFWDFGDGSTTTGINVSHTYSTANTYIVTLIVCADTTQSSLLVSPSPSANAGADDEMCAIGQYTLSGSATDYSSILWTSNGDGSFDDPTLLNATYTPGSGDITAGLVTLTLTAYAIFPCSNAIDDMNLSIQAAPVADAGADTTSCEGAAITLAGIATNQSSNLWSTAGDGTFDDPGLLNATYTPGTNDLSNGSVLLTLTADAILPCTSNVSDDMLLSFPMQPTASAGGDDLICENTPYTLSGSATNYSSILWTSGGDGSFDDPSLLNATYTPGASDIVNGTVILTLTAEAIEPCIDATDDMILDIQQLPDANAGDDAGICEGETYTLAGTASNQSSISWTTGGDGSFDNTTILNPTYTPGSGDISNGGALLTLTAAAISPCSTNMIDAMFLSIDPMVGTPTTPDGPTMVDSYLTPTSEYETQTTTAADGYKWTLSPTSAGDITGTDLIGLVSWDTAYQGFAYVKVIAFNSCNAITSDSLEIEVTTSVGLAEHNKKQLIVSITPNPSNGSFKISIEGIDRELELSIISSQSRLIKHILLEQAESFEHTFNFSHLPKGLYILKLHGANMLHIEKIIVQ